MCIFLPAESGIVADADMSTSVGDTSSEAQGPSPRRTPGVRSYLDLMKSRVLKQKVAENQMFTDVSESAVVYIIPCVATNRKLLNISF